MCKLISIPLAQVKSPDDFWVQAEVSWQEGSSPKSSQWLKHYGCDTFQHSPQELLSTYQTENNTLKIRATNVCGQEIRSGGYVESIRIRAADGTVAKEWYNQESTTQDIPLEGLAAGMYTAEIRSGDETETINFAVAAATSPKATSSRRWLLWVFALACIGIAGAWYYRRKHRIKKMSEKQPL